MARHLSLGLALVVERLLTRLVDLNQDRILDQPLIRSPRDRNADEAAGVADASREPALCEENVCIARRRFARCQAADETPDTFPRSSSVSSTNSARRRIFSATYSTASA